MDSWVLLIGAGAIAVASWFTRSLASVLGTVAVLAILLVVLAARDHR